MGLFYVHPDFQHFPTTFQPQEVLVLCPEIGSLGCWKLTVCASGFGWISASVSSFAPEICCCFRDGRTGSFSKAMFLHLQAVFPAFSGHFLLLGFQWLVGVRLVYLLHQSLPRLAIPALRRLNEQGVPSVLVHLSLKTSQRAGAGRALSQPSPAIFCPRIARQWVCVFSGHSPAFMLLEFHLVHGCSSTFRPLSDRPEVGEFLLFLG
ncbi:UNVERIFIED_CONTAM: hypothetical protein Slati_1879300 [Sesamum latifolium]|uniref:Uncharacterized protein n=1 Tax=Sesamum latifolium TaxID=2727402 RepID=A0AAW2WZY0_9LAMI